MLITDFPGVEGSRLIVSTFVLAPLVVVGYVGLTVLLFVPLLGLRMLFRRPIASRTPTRSLAVTRSRWLDRPALSGGW
jgi:hypothetical protein